MKKLGVLFPAGENARNALQAYPELAKIIVIPEEKSKKQIFRIIDNTQYDGCRNILMMLNKYSDNINCGIKGILGETDLFQFNAKLAEFYLFYHIDSYLPGKIKRPTAGRSDVQCDWHVSDNGLELFIEVYNRIEFYGINAVFHYCPMILKYLEIDLGFEN